VTTSFRFIGIVQRPTNCNIYFYALVSLGLDFPTFSVAVQRSRSTILPNGSLGPSFTDCANSTWTVQLEDLRLKRSSESRVGNHFR
jgi:hypothetical protein